MVKVFHVISGISRKAGGPSRSSQGLVAALCQAGVDAWIYSFDNADPWILGVRKFTQTLSTQTLKHFDLIHIHGIWDRRLHQVAVMCRKAGVPYVIAPRGMLEPWSLKQKWLKKRIARFLYQDRDLKLAAALHATAESEAEQFRRLGFKNRIIISPNGVNVPSSFPTPTPSTSTSNKARRALFVSRMHPKKGVMELVESWARVKPKNWQCELVYTMNSDEVRAYEKRVKQRVLDLGMTYSESDNSTVRLQPSPSPKSPDFIFTGSLDDDAKWAAYARADLFVLPTYSENFGIVVAEALWAGVPVITTKGTPWEDVISAKCGWWIDLPENSTGGWLSLDRAIGDACRLDGETLVKLGENGRKLVEEKYLWSSACGVIENAYKQILRNHRNEGTC